MKKIYEHYIPVKLLFVLELVCGTILLSVFAYLFKNDIYLNGWSIAGPLLGIGLVITGLTSSKIKDISFNNAQQCLEINKESLFVSDCIKIKLNHLSTALKTTNGKKSGLNVKLKLVFIDGDDEVVEIHSNFLGANNKKLKKLHAYIKEVTRSEVTPI